MESMDITPADKPGFFRYLFELTGDEKSNLFNYIQYILLAIIPVVVILRIIRNYVPDEDEDKGNATIVAEVVAQVLAVFMGIWLIDRVIRYIPTYSGAAYQPMYLTNFVIALLMMLLTVQSRLGSKIDSLVSRALEFVGLDSSDEEPKPKATKKKAAVHEKPHHIPVPPVRQNDPMAGLHQAAPPGHIPPPAQHSRDFNSMYEMDITPMPGAHTPGVGQTDIMAANDFGGGFGSAY